MSLGETTTGETTTTVINLTKSQSKKSACLYSSYRPKKRTGMGQDKKRADIFQNGSFLFLSYPSTFFVSRRSTQGPSHLTPSLLIQCKTGGQLSDMQSESLLKFTQLEGRPFFPGQCFSM